MNINDVTARKEYVGNGVTTIFAYDFGIVSTSDIEVIVGGVVQTLGTHYSVSGAGVDAGGNVTFVTAPSNTVNVILLRKQPFSQLSVYQANEDFPAKRLETDLSKLGMISQQLREIVERCLKFGEPSLKRNQVVDDPIIGGLLRYKDSIGNIESILPSSIVTGGAIGLPLTLTQGGTGVDNQTGLTKVALLALSPSVGKLVRVIDAERGWWASNGTRFYSLSNEKINVKEYGALGDGKSVADAAITTGTPNLSSVTAGFVVTDVGKTVVVIGAGVAGAPLVTTILSWQNSSAVTLSINASTTVSNAKLYWGTNDTAAFQNAINAAQTRGAIVEVSPPDSGFYICQTSLTYAISAISYPPIILGASKYGSPILYAGTGQWIGPVATTGYIVGGHFERLQIQLCQTGAVGIDSSGLTSTTFRSLSGFWKGSGSNGGTLLKSSPAGAQVSFFNIVDDCESNSMSVHTLLDNPNSVAGAPNRWRFIAPTVLAPNAANTVEGIKIGTGGGGTVSGTQIIGINLDQQGGGGVVLGSKADRTEITGVVSETAQGGAAFNISDLANRTTVLGIKVPVGLYFVGATQYGLRAFVMADWDIGLQWSGATSTTLLGLVRDSDNALRLSATRLVPAQFIQAYSASITIDASLGNEVDITATNGTAFTINAPTNPTTGQILVITIRNTSGGALGVITWNAVFKMLAFTSPTNNNACDIMFKYDSANWRQIAPQSLQIPL